MNNKEIAIKFFEIMEIKDYSKRIEKLETLALIDFELTSKLIELYDCLDYEEYYVNIYHGEPKLIKCFRVVIDGNVKDCRNKITKDLKDNFFYNCYSKCNGGQFELSIRHIRL